MGGAVGEEVVDEHANEREEEDNQAPDNFVQRRAVRLDDLNCTRISAALSCRVEIFVPQAITSSTRMMKPAMPPPVGPCHEVP